MSGHKQGRISTFGTFPDYRSISRLSEHVPTFGAFLDLLDSQRLSEVDAWDNGWIAEQAGNSAHEVRTWVAAFAALAAQGSYRTADHFYRAAPELIAGFAIRTAVTTP